MKRMARAVWGLGLVGICGCTTVGMEQQRNQEMRLAGEVSDLRITVQRLEHRMAGLSAEQDVMGQDLERLRGELRQGQVRQQADLAGLVARLDAQSKAQVALRKELADDLSSRMAAILETQTRAQAAAHQRTTARGPRAQTGYEHEVQPGETLSEIARAYGVSSAAIIEANQMRNPDVLRAGQKLFIPAQGR